MKIAIDCGHGSNTAGKRTAPFTHAVDIDHDDKNDIKKGQQYREHYANVMVANFLYAEMVRQGFEVFKSAWDDNDASDDPDIDLSKRQTAIRAAGCDYSVSIHFNACGDGKSFNNGQGIETLIHSTKTYRGDSEALANKVQSYLSKGTKQTNRGVKQQQLAMCNCYRMHTKASILVELAFMTNQHEAMDLMASSEFCQECAREICQGFCEYLGQSYIGVTKYPYIAKVIKEGLWVRKTPSLDDKTCVMRLSYGGKYTIMEHDPSGEFGRLKSGVGWVYLKHMQKC